MCFEISSFENNVYLHDRLCVLEFNSLAIILIVNNPACFQVLAVFTPYIEWGKKDMKMCEFLMASCRERPTTRKKVGLKSCTTQTRVHTQQRFAKSRHMVCFFLFLINCGWSDDPSWMLRSCHNIHRLCWHWVL